MRLRLAVDGAGDGLAQLVVVGVIGVGGDVVEGVGLLREVAGAVVLELRGLAIGVGDGRRQAVGAIDGRGGLAVGVGGRSQVALAIVNVGGGVAEGIGDGEDAVRRRRRCRWSCCPEDRSR